MTGGSTSWKPTVSQNSFAAGQCSRRSSRVTCWSTNRIFPVNSTAPPSTYRWVVLGVGSGATAALAAVQGGLPAISPAIQEAFDLSLVQVTAVFTAFGVGTVLTLLAWGGLSDRAGERLVIGGGLAAASLAMFAAAAVNSYTALLVWMTLAGMLGSSGIAASGRAVFGWFPRDERG